MHLVLLETNEGRFSVESPELPGVLFQSHDELTARRLIAEALSAAKNRKNRPRNQLTGILYLCLATEQ